MKQLWQKPELVVLYRGRPEESVLTYCKHHNNPPVAPAANYDACNSSPATCTACQGNTNAS